MFEYSEADRPSQQDNSPPQQLSALIRECFPCASTPQELCEQWPGKLKAIEAAALLTGQSMQPVYQNQELFNSLPDVLTQKTGRFYGVNLERWFEENYKKPGTYAPYEPCHNLRDRIEQEVPRLRRYARALTRDDVYADDLVQDCLVRGLAKQHLWKDGTDLRAWLFTILHNQYVNQVRRMIREGAAVELDDTMPDPLAHEHHTDLLELRDLDRSMAKLKEEQRTAVLLVGLEGMRMEAVAEIVGIPLGTVKSRLFRGRENLRAYMNG